jgi:hypothetical protein
MFPRRSAALLSPLFLIAVSPVPAEAGGKPSTDPPVVDIYSGKALNILLWHISRAHSKGQRGPRIPLKAELLKQLNVAPHAGENFGLLRNGGKLTWPKAFDGKKFQEDRKKVEGQVKRALRALEQGTAVEKRILADLDVGIKRLAESLAADVNDIPPSEYIPARRYLNYLGDAARALQRPDAAKYLDGTYSARGKTVQEVVERMPRLGLVFVEAVPGQEAAYQAVYQALAAYTRGLTAEK